MGSYGGSVVGHRRGLCKNSSGFMGILCNIGMEEACNVRIGGLKLVKGDSMKKMCVVLMGLVLAAGCATQSIGPGNKVVSDAKEQCRIGDCYWDGIGVDKDAKEAVVWYRKAAGQGMARAQYCLGDCYYHGEGVEKDFKEAVKWYRKSAEQGNASAQVWLGCCYLNGEGVKKDVKEAAKWLEKSAKQGNVDAKNWLEYCSDE